MNRPTTADTRASDQRTATGLAAVVGAVLVYCLVHGGFRLLASGSLGEDDPLESLLVQDLRLIYRAPQPPLYDWVLHAVQRVLGPGVGGFLVIKYAALIATAGFLYVTALRMLKERIWAILAVESMALIYQIAWRYHEGFTHEVGAMVAVAASLWAFERVVSLGRVTDFAVLGVAIGLGLMTELTYGVFLVSMFAAALLQPAIATRLTRPRLALTGVIALIIASPYLGALATTAEPLTWVVRHSTSWTTNLAKGVLDALRGPLFYLSPLVVLLPFFIPGFAATAAMDVKTTWNTWNARSSARSRICSTPHWPLFVLHQGLAALLLCLLGAVLLGASGYAMHRLMPLYLPAVIWLMGVAERAGTDAAPRRRLARFAIAIAVVALAARLANMFVLDPVCKICRWGIPYAGLAAEMSARGIAREAQGTIAVVEHELGGNLRVHFPLARVIAPGTARALTPKPGEPLARPLAFVWSASAGDADAVAAHHLTPLLPPGVRLTDAATIEVPWRHLWRPTGYRSSRWRVLVLP